ncbi:MAG: imelysin family protein [Flavobacteriales bacterium]|nr:imelysin family protein [Flavobacteriales bacterium]
MRYSKLVLLFLFIATIGAYQSCKKTESAEYDRVLLVQELVNNVILPRQQSAQDKTFALYNAAQAFKTDASFSNFQTLRQEWLESKKAYKLIELFNLGDVYDTYMHNKMNKWPCNTTFIDDMLADVVVLDQAYIDTKGSTAKGLPALEYLLFDPTLSETEMHMQLTSSADFARRKDLIEAYSQDLYFKAYFLNDLWAMTGENYGQTFVTNSPRSGLESPVNIICNALVAQAERIYASELGQALGNYNGGTPDETLAEAFRSRESLACIRASIISLLETLNGKMDGLSDSASLRNHLIACGASATATDIEEHLSESIILIDNYNTSLAEGVTSSPQTLQEIRSHIQNVVVLLKTEAFPSLGITLTFNDNDGD